MFRNMLFLLTNPKHPLESSDSYDKNRLEQEGERRLSTSKTSVQESNPGDDEPDDASTNHQPNVMEFHAGILEVHIDVQGVASIGLGWVKCRCSLGCCQYSCSRCFEGSCQYLQTCLFLSYKAV